MLATKECFLLSGVPRHGEGVITGRDVQGVSRRYNLAIRLHSQGGNRVRLAEAGGHHAACAEVQCSQAGEAGHCEFGSIASLSLGQGAGCRCQCVAAERRRGGRR